MVKIAVGFNAYPLPGGRELFRRLYTEYVSYFDLGNGVLLITFCTHAESPFFICIKRHPTDIYTYVKFLFTVSVILLKLFLNFGRRVEAVYFFTGSISAPLLALARFLGKRVFLAELGDWPSIIYYKLLFTRGPKLASLGRRVATFLRKISLTLAELVATNSPVVYRALGGRASLHVQRRELSCVGSGPRDYVVYVGRLDYEKGVLRMLLDIRRIYDMFRRPVVIAGVGPLEGVVSSLNSRVVRYIGFLKPDEVAGLLSRAYAVIIPSYTEGFPSVYLEAKRCGVPYIVMYSDNPLSKWLANVILET